MHLASSGVVVGISYLQGRDPGGDRSPCILHFTSKMHPKKDASGVGVLDLLVALCKHAHKSNAASAQQQPQKRFEDTTESSRRPWTRQKAMHLAFCKQETFQKRLPAAAGSLIADGTLQKCTQEQRSERSTAAPKPFENTIEISRRRGEHE